MIYLVGDVQGCSDALERMLAEMAFSPSRDNLVVLGDLVNRGPGSLAVLRRLRSFGEAAICLLGNHDLHLLAVAHGVRKLGKGDTFGDVLAAPDAAACTDWLRQRPLAHMAAGWLCVHAGVLPSWTTAQTLEHAAEVALQLRSTQHADVKAFLQSMYGNAPQQWDDALVGTDRWRVIVNTLTRLRFCTANGRMDLATKEGPGAAPDGHFAWFDVPGRRTADQPMAFGHWSMLGLINRPELLALDTGCVWGGALTAMRVDGGRRELLQVRCTAAAAAGR